MVKEKSKVALVRCSSYDREEVEAAVREAVQLLGGFEEIMSARDGFAEVTKESELVLKPNLLAKAAPEKAVTTHPEVFRAVGKLLKESGYSNLSYGDSPGNLMLSVEKTAEGCGIKKAADELGIRPGDFEHGTEIEFEKGRAAKHFVLCNEVAAVTEEAGGAPDGGIINICKMKTHQLERITGAVKNTFGCVYGINKTASHAKFSSAEHFARMVADLNGLVRPRLHVMDGIVAMEGNGPGSGDPVPMNVILASTDPVALDVTFCRLIDLTPELVPTNTACADARIGIMNEADIEVILGGVPMQPEGARVCLDEIAVKYGNSEFNVQRAGDYRGGFRFMKLTDPFINKKPAVLADRCIGCGICVETCPVEGKAISLSDGGEGSGKKIAAYDYSKCIKCYCCQEMCPEKAITVKKSLLAKIIDRKWKM